VDSPGLDQIAALSALDDPVRRRLYEHVSGATEPVGRDAAAAAAGVTRSLAAYHLDRLAAEGLLEVAYERRSGRSGPGAGRPAKLYARAEREFSASAPPRDYGLAARLLAEAAASDPSGATASALRDAAGRLGREAAGEPGEVAELLTARGYEPYDDDGVLRLRNCPFHAAARRHPEVVCDMNLALLRGLLDDRDVEAVLEPGPGRCCVALRR
jgi:predicted ArsR family transcriptional regulator